MSTFLNAYFVTMPAATTVLQVQTEILSKLTANSWQIVAQALPPLATSGTLGTVANAFDADPATLATSASALPLTLIVHMAAGYTPTKMRLLGSVTPTESPNTFTLDFSDDGAAWTTLQTWTGEASWYATGTRDYVVTGAASHAWWRLNVTAKNGGASLTIKTWRLEDAAGNQITNAIQADVIPPATETVGNTKYQEVVRIYFTSTAISFGSYLTAKIDAIPQRLSIVALTAGAVTPSVIIDGVTISGATGSGGTTANQNLQALYYALKASGNAAITAWDFWYNGTDRIVGINKTIQAPKVLGAGTNVTHTQLNYPVLAGATSDFGGVFFANSYVVTVDLTAGFIYYLQVNARSLVLGTKTNASFYGPIFASYCDNATAIAALPTGSGDCSPIELFVGQTSTNDSACVYRTTHFWAAPSGYTSAVAQQNTNVVSANFGILAGNTAHPLATGSMPGGIQDVAPSGHPANLNIQLTGYALALDPTQGPVGAQFKVVPVGTFNVGSNIGSYLTAPIFWTQTLLDDVYKWTGAESNETLALASNIRTRAYIGAANNLAADLDDTTMYAALTLDTVAGLPTAGIVSVGLELFSYTGVSGATLTGVTRGIYGSGKSRHYIGDGVTSAYWYAKINNGAIYSGNAKPS